MNILPIYANHYSIKLRANKAVNSNTSSQRAVLTELSGNNNYYIYFCHKTNIDNYCIKNVRVLIPDLKCRKFAWLNKDTLKGAIADRKTEINAAFEKIKKEEHGEIKVKIIQMLLGLDGYDFHTKMAVKEDLYSDVAKIAEKRDQQVIYKKFEELYIGAVESFKEKIGVRESKEKIGVKKNKEKIGIKENKEKVPYLQAKINFLAFIFGEEKINNLVKTHNINSLPELLSVKIKDETIKTILKSSLEQFDTSKDDIRIQKAVTEALFNLDNRDRSTIDEIKKDFDISSKLRRLINDSKARIKGIIDKKAIVEELSKTQTDASKTK